jgi:hypothetical protein
MTPPLIVTKKRETSQSLVEFPSSLGQSLFYRPIRTVTGHILDEEEKSYSYLYYMEI